MSKGTTEIIGVDFSGSKKNNTTAVTSAVLRNNILQVTDCHPLESKLDSAESLLRKLLEGLHKDSVVAMDFPFSIPKDAAALFPEPFIPGFATMPDLWRTATEIDDLDKFAKLPPVKDHATTMRHGDKQLKNPNPIPPLKAAGNPTLLHMTFHGMKMLHRLREAHPRSFHIPPLSRGGRTGPVLLETNPGTVLSNLDLHYKSYKGKRKGVGKKRNEILTGMKTIRGLTLRMAPEFRYECLANDDCLDSLVAAVVAALWKKDKSKGKSTFRTPSKSQLSDAKLEGWIYVPKPRRK